MKLLQQIQYFFYIATNWGIRIGFFTLREEIKGEKKYNINTTSYHNLSRFQITGSHLKHATEYMPVNYFTIEQLLYHLPANAKQGSFLDIGCGKGRGLCVAAVFGFKKVVGIDFAKQLIDTAEKNLAQIKTLYPSLEYTLHWKDVVSFEIGQDVSTVFMFNPFDEILMRTVIQKINTALKNHPRPFYILYASPMHEELFFAEGYDVLYRVKKLNYLEGILLKAPKIPAD